MCFESFPVPAMAAALCAHYYCKNCWRGYIHTAINGGPTCLDLRCIHPGCGAMVPRPIIDEVCDLAHRRRFETFAMRSYVEDSKRLCWCPAPGVWRVGVEGE